MSIKFLSLFLTFATIANACYETVPETDLYNQAMQVAKAEPRQAAVLLTQAAQEKSPHALEALGRMYELKYDNDKDLANLHTAIKFYGQAADGSNRARLNLGKACLRVACEQYHVTINNTLQDFLKSAVEANTLALAQQHEALRWALHQAQQAFEYLKLNLTPASSSLPKIYHDLGLTYAFMGDQDTRAKQSFLLAIGLNFDEASCSLAKLLVKEHKHQEAKLVLQQAIQRCYVPAAQLLSSLISAEIANTMIIDNSSDSDEEQEDAESEARRKRIKIEH